MKSGIFAYPWDLAAEGHDQALGRIASAGLNAVNLACAYHAGKFLSPHNPQRRVYFAEDGALYFRPRLERYGRIKPRVSQLATEATDPVSELDRHRRTHGLDMVAWVVCLHNSWLGERYPDCTLHTAFGDPLMHSLCPAHPDVRAYLVTMLTDLLSQAEFSAIHLESPAYMGFRHGFHHELIGTRLGPITERLLSLSFNPVELERARAAGIDAERIQRQVADALMVIWQFHPLDDEEEAEISGIQDLLQNADFKAFLDLRQQIAIEHVAELREAIKSVSPQTEVRLLAPLGVAGVDRSPDADLGDLADGIVAGNARSDRDARVRARSLQRTVPGKPVYGMIRAIAPDTLHPAQLPARVHAWRDGGAAGIDFDNYGLMTLTMLDGIADALARHA